LKKFYVNIILDCPEGQLLVQVPFTISPFIFGGLLYTLKNSGDDKMKTTDDKYPLTIN